MEIAVAVQRGAFVYLYDKDGIPLSVVPAGTGPQEGLKGYTSGTVTVQRGQLLYTYDRLGQPVTTTFAG